MAWHGRAWQSRWDGMAWQSRRDGMARTHGQMEWHARTHARTHGQMEWHARTDTDGMLVVGRRSVGWQTVDGWSVGWHAALVAAFLFIFDNNNYYYRLIN
jgi:hypothetical protein